MIKVLRAPAGPADVDAPQIRSIASLHHPNIVQLLDSGITATGHSYEVMNRIDGLELDVYLDRRLNTSPRPFDEITQLFVRICEPIAFAHRKRVIHCDLKPRNIMVDQRGEPWILDFGMAANLGARGLLESRLAKFLGAGGGTVAYAAPEQLNRQFGTIDRRTDVHALGAIFYQMLTGRRPYAEVTSTHRLIRRINEGRAPVPSRDAPGLGQRFDSVVKRAMAKNPDRRYPSAGELRDAVIGRA